MNNPFRLFRVPMLVALTFLGLLIMIISFRFHYGNANYNNTFKAGTINGGPLLENGGYENENYGITGANVVNGENENSDHDFPHSLTDNEPNIDSLNSEQKAEHLLGLLRDNSIYFRERTVKELAKLTKDPQATLDMITLGLNDKDPRIRKETIENVGLWVGGTSLVMGAKQKEIDLERINYASGFLRNALRDDDGGVRKAAVKIVAPIAEYIDGVASELVSLLKRQDEQPLFFIYIALGNLGPNCLNELIGGIDVNNIKYIERFVECMIYMEELGVDVSSAKDIMVKLLDSDKYEIKEQAVWFLGSLGGKAKDILSKLYYMRDVNQDHDLGYMLKWAIREIEK